MRRHRKTLTLAAAALTASLAGLGALGAPAGAAAASSTAPTIAVDGSCSATCLPGAGDVGVAYATFVEGFDPLEYSYTISLVSGSLPPGLQLSPIDIGFTDDQITGTPTTAGTYDFTLKITDTSGASSTQPFSIPIGTGAADNLDITQAFDDHLLNGDWDLGVNGVDPNEGATYTVYLTSTGQELGTMTDTNLGFLSWGGNGNPIPQNLTIKDSLGSSVTVPVVVEQQRKY